MAQPGVVAPWRAAYVPGDWYVIAGPTSLVVLEPGAGRGDMIGDLWADVVASSSMTDLVDRLAGYGITELPDLAVVFWSSAGMRTLLRGGVRLLDPSSGAQVATGAGVVTWSEVGLEKLTRVRIGVGGEAADGESLPLSVGVVRAGAVLLSADSDAVVRSPQPLLGSAGSRGRAAAQVVPAEAGTSTGPGATGGPETAGRPGGLASAPGGAGPDESGLDDTGPDFPPIADDGEPDTGESPAVGLDSPWGPQAVAGGPAGGVGSVGAAAGAVAGAAGAGAGAVGAGAGAAGARAGAGVSGAAGVGADAAAAARGTGGAAAGAVGAGGSAGLGSRAGGAVSSASPGTAAVVGSGGAVGPGGTSTPAEFSIEQFEMENDDTQLIANPVPSGPGSPTTRPGVPAATGPLVEAVRCPNGHPNAPGSTVCRVCRSPIAARPPELIPEPLLARLRTADGTVVDIDRPILLGRAPSEQRSAVPLPRLVTLASPAQDISRTHLQVAPENWQVMVTDLNSTNGTFVSDPGPSGNRGLLPPGQPTPVPIGAVMELGEGVTLIIEPAD